MSFFNFEVTGDEQLVNEFYAAGRDLDAVMSSAARRLKPYIRDQIIEVFRNASANAGAGFPSEYQQQLMSIVGHMPLTVVSTGIGIEVEIFLDDALGTYEEFEQGFHYHASLGEGDIVGLPYEGEELKNSYEKRLAFWESIATGTHIPGQAKVEGKYDETIAARLAFWDSIGKAPQWLLLNYGQTETYPPVHPYPIIEEIGAIEYSGLGSILNEEIDSSLKRIFTNRYTPMPTEYHTFPSKSGYEYIRIGGRFAGSRKKV